MIRIKMYQRCCICGAMSAETRISEIGKLPWCRECWARSEAGLLPRLGTIRIVDDGVIIRGALMGCQGGTDPEENGHHKGKGRAA